MNLIDVSRELATDEQRLAFLEKQRWPDGLKPTLIRGGYSWEAQG
jgi:hypothetical protein